MEDLSGVTMLPITEDDDIRSNMSVYDDGIITNDNSSNVTSPEGEFQFNRRLLMNVLAYSVMCVVGSIGNAVVFVAAYRQHVSPENQHGRRNNVHIMVVHLTIADLFVSFVVMPLEIGWRLSVQWFAGNAACKMLMFIRAFAFYLSSATLVVLSIDRYIAIAQPMATLKMNVTRRRGRIMILLAWLSAALFALPQTFVFRVLKHPQVDFYQCTSMGFFAELLNGNLSTNIMGNVTANDGNKTASFLGLGPEDLERIYSSIFLVAVYMVPLLVIVVTYANILAKIVRKRRASSEAGTDGATATSVQRHSSQGNLLNQEGGDGAGGGDGQRRVTAQSSGRRHLHRRNNGSGHGYSGSGSHAGASSNSSLMCRNRQLRFARSQTVALRMSTMHVLAFVGCWTPYLVISAWHIVDPDGVGNDVSPEVQDALFLTAVFNSCINPLVYGGFYFRALKKSRKRQQQREREMYLQSHCHSAAPGANNTPSKMHNMANGGSFKGSSIRNSSQLGRKAHHQHCVMLEPGSQSEKRPFVRRTNNSSSVSSSGSMAVGSGHSRETSFHRNSQL